ncbi:MAG: SHOCT-like domain-containing protein [Anaerolineales bacterium]
MMATSEERLKILQMIQDGKITAEDGAKLLAALSEGGRRQRPISRQTEARYMRVRVTDMVTGKTKVSVNLPLGLVSAGMNIASNFVPEVGIVDLSDAISAGLTGKVVDVIDEEDGEHVEIYIE